MNVRARACVCVHVCMAKTPLGGEKDVVGNTNEDFEQCGHRDLRGERTVRQEDKSADIAQWR